MNKMSIIIPVRNREQLLGHTLESASRQQWRPLEVIVVDNGSTDGSRTVAEQWTEKLGASGIEARVISEDNPGAARARSRGAEESTGDVLSFFDSDDTMRPQFSTEIMKKFSADNRTELVFWQRTYHSSHGRVSRMKWQDKLTVAGHIVHSQLSTQSCALSRSLYDRSGGWNRELSYWDDWELGIRYITALRSLEAPTVVPIKQELVDVYGQTDSITGIGYLHAEKAARKALAAAHGEAERHGGDEMVRLRRLLACKEAVLAAHYAREGGTEESRRMMEDALRHAGSQWARGVVKAMYEYTRRGLRGAFSWGIPLLM